MTVSALLTEAIATLRFCPACGADGLTRPEVKRLHCPACDFSLFLNAATAAAAILTHDDHLALTVRRHEPRQGLLDLPGGFVDPGESAEHGLRRELREELGISVDTLTYLGSWPNVYPYGGVIYQTCDVVFTAPLVHRQLRANDDVAAIEWHPITRLPLERIGFPSIRAALQRYVGNAQGQPLAEFLMANNRARLPSR